MKVYHWHLTLLAFPTMLAPTISALQLLLQAPRSRNLNGAAARHQHDKYHMHHSQKRTTSSSSLYFSSITATTPETPEFSGAFDSNQMDALQQRGELEASLMEHSFQGPLEAPAKKKNKKNVAKNKQPSAAIFARELKRQGVVRVNNALSASTAAILRDDILERRTKAYDAVVAGEDWRQYFADVLLKSNRCDLLLPLQEGRDNSPIQTALRELLDESTTLSKVLSSTLTDHCILYEFASLISEPGSPRQPVHPDNPYQPHPPLLTCFIALQDIDNDMGPTVFLPKTHTKAAHDQFDDIALDDVSNRNNLLRDTPNVAAQLDAGDVAVFDSRTMHCGGANTSISSTRALLYMSFRNPSVNVESIGNVGSILPGIGPITLGKLREQLLETQY